MQSLIAWCDAHFVENWRRILKRAWSIRVAAFWGLLGGLVALLPLVSDETKALVGPWAFALAFLAMFVSVTVARFLKQPGTEE